MKIKTSIQNIMRRKSDNKKEGTGPNSRKFNIMALSAILIIAAAAIYLLKEPLKEDKANPFESCGILEESCMDTSCAFYSSCGQSGWQSCKIYDCGNDYGIYFMDRDGKVTSKREAKPDNKAIEAEKEACKGTMEILEQNCADNKYQAKVKIATKGECKIGNFFIFDENDQSQPNNFTRLDDNTYVITSDVCKKITDIIPASVSGMALEF